MGFDNKYPYTDFHELNFDWILEKVKGIDDRFVAIEDAVAALREDLDIQTGRIDAALDAITFIQNHYPAMIASEYDESRQYDPGEIAIYDNELYIALPGETPGPWNGNYWNKTSLGDELGTIIIKVNDIILPDLTNINNVLAEYGTLFDDIVETYVPGSTYTKNQMVKYQDHIYRVMVARTNNPPTDLTDWDPETLANVVTDVLNNESINYNDFPVTELWGNPFIFENAVYSPIKKADVNIPSAGVASLTFNISGKNLYDQKDLESGSISNTGDETDATVALRSASYFQTFENRHYYINAGSGFKVRRLALYDADKSLIIRLSPNSQMTDIDVKGTYSNVRYIRPVIQNSAETDISPEDITALFIVDGDSSFTYEPYEGSVHTVEFGTTVYGGHYDFITGTGEDGSNNPIAGQSFTIYSNSGYNTVWTDGVYVMVDYHYADKSTDYTPDDRVVAIGTYSGKRVLQINHFEQNVSLDGSLKSFNILPPDAILINAWAYGKGNDDGSMANMNPWWSTTAGDLCIMASSWASNTTADIWMYAQYVE